MHNRHMHPANALKLTRQRTLCMHTVGPSCWNHLQLNQVHHGDQNVRKLFDVINVKECLLKTETKGRRSAAACGRHRVCCV